MNVVAEIQRINERELALGVPLEASWHQKYRDSAWIYAGGLPFELTEGDVLCVFSQFGEIEDVNLVRDAKTGKSKGFAFLKFEDQRSTILAVDNFNGAKLLDRVVRVDHVLKYKLPKELQDREDQDSDEEQEDREHRQRGLPGHAYEGKELASEFDISKGQNVFAAPEESKKDKKRRRKEEKKLKKEAKKVHKMEKKQMKLFEEIKKKRQQQREAEERERQLAAQNGDVDLAAPAPSSTGWRGRLEPNAAPPQRGSRPGGDRGRGPQDDKSFGGMSRVR